MRLRVTGAVLVAFVVGRFGVVATGGAEVAQDYVTSWFGNTFGSAEQAFIFLESETWAEPAS